MKFIETSAKNNSNIDDLFMNLSSDIRKNVNIQPIKNDNKITLNNTMIINQGNNGCGC